MDHWLEIVENGVHEFRRNFGGACGMMLRITKLNIPDAWACSLPDGKRVVGELQDFRRRSSGSWNKAVSHEVAFQNSGKMIPDPPVNSRHSRFTLGRGIAEVWA